MMTPLLAISKPLQRLLPLLCSAFAIAFLLALAGCASADYAGSSTISRLPKPEPVVLREGDIVKVAFPGAANLNPPQQQIRRDGKINLPIIGEVTAAGLTPEQLEADLRKRYEGQILTKEITVTVESSTFPVYVAGAVLRPGKVLSDHPITALEAIMEAGGPDFNRANLKGVSVLRNEKNRTDKYTLDLRRVLKGGESTPFYLRPNDIVYVPEKFTWW